MVYFINLLAISFGDETINSVRVTEKVFGAALTSGLFLFCLLVS